jgi:Zn-dependent peptidase ImmA (M78 family)
LDAKFVFDQKLGTNARGQQTLGACYFEPTYKICIDPSITGDDPRFRFTLAHELGHLSLHRKLRLEFQSLDATARAILDGEDDLTGGPRQLQTPRDFLEWQANSYAAALLMPRVTFAGELRTSQTALGITRGIGVVWLTDGSGSRHDYDETVRRLSSAYQTSRTATRIRLQELDLLRDLRATQEAVAIGALGRGLSEALQQLLRRYDSWTENNDN